MSQNIDVEIALMDDVSERARKNRDVYHELYRQALGLAQTLRIKKSNPGALGPNDESKDRKGYEAARVAVDALERTFLPRVSVPVEPAPTQPKRNQRRWWRFWKSR